MNVRYVLEGSVQRGGARMRVNVQLIDADTGNHLWAERFDKLLGDPFDTQDEIVARLANLIRAQVTAAEAKRAKRAPNPDAMDFYLQGWALGTKESRLRILPKRFDCLSAPWRSIPRTFGLGSRSLIWT